MHKHHVPVATVLLGLLLAVAAPGASAIAQSETPTQPARKPPAKPAPKPAKPTKPATTAKSEPAGPPLPPPPPPPIVPPAPPPVVVIPPPLDVPTRPVQPPPPVPIVADAPGDALPVKDGIRLTFGAGRSDLNQATADAVRAVAHDLAPAATVSVNAFAGGSPDDPSTPRRVSLARALNVRALLITEGVASTRINVRAFGATQGAADGPADRVDVTVVASSAPPAAATPATPPVAAPAPSTPAPPQTATP
jgi:outer membrane protein OmpA-like peptidoglycan-associated protein